MWTRCLLSIIVHHFVVVEDQYEQKQNVVRQTAIRVIIRIFLFHGHATPLAGGHGELAEIVHVTRGHKAPEMAEVRDCYHHVEGCSSHPREAVLLHVTHDAKCHRLETLDHASSHQLQVRLSSKLANIPRVVSLLSLIGIGYESTQGLLAAGDHCLSQAGSKCSIRNNKRCKVKRGMVRTS